MGAWESKSRKGPGKYLKYDSVVISLKNKSAENWFVFQKKKIPPLGDKHYTSVSCVKTCIMVINQLYKILKKEINSIWLLLCLIGTFF